MRARAFVVAFLLSCSVQAYPTSAVFTPTAEAKPLGTVGMLAYGATQLRPHAAPGQTWLGVQVGVLPQWSLGGGLQFGGLEVGADVFSPDEAGRAKPVLNGKLSVVTEGVYTPSLALGLMEVSPALPSLNFAYVAVTKTLRFAGTSFGRTTLGLGVDAGRASLFQATFPFKSGRTALMVAYETPLLFDRVGVVVDWLGGASELSSLYAGVTLVVSDTTTATVGGFRSNTREIPSDGAFGSLNVSFDVSKLAKSP